MKKIYTEASTLFCLLLLMAFSLASCSSNDGLNTKELVVYFPLGQTNYNLTQNKVTFTKGMAISDFKLPIMLTRPTSKDVMVTAIIESSLIEKYEELYPSERKIADIPEGAFSLSNAGSVLIKSGNTKSEESIVLEILKPELININDFYVIPIVLDMSTHKVPLSENRNIMFVELNFNTARIGLTNELGQTTSNMFIEKDSEGYNSSYEVQLKCNLNNILNIDTEISIEENISLIDDYNKENNLECVALPAGCFDLVQNSSVIESGKLIANEDFKVVIKDLGGLDLNKDYLLPIQLKYNSDVEGAAFIAKGKEVAYILINIYENIISSDNPEVDGVPIDPSDWAAEASYNEYPISAIFYEHLNAFWASEEPGWFSIDMKESKAVKGFVIEPSYPKYYGDFTQIEVHTSTDGKTWKLEGTYNGELGDERKNITFKSAIKSRYFKFTMAKDVTGNNIIIISKCYAYE